MVEEEPSCAGSGGTVWAGGASDSACRDRGEVIVREEQTEHRETDGIAERRRAGRNGK